MIITKWDLISVSEREVLERTPCGLNCSGCGITLATEADFARHFIVKDRRYKNLGECPNKLLAKHLGAPKYCHCGNIVRRNDLSGVRLDYCAECNDFRCDIDETAMHDCQIRAAAFQKALCHDAGI